MAEPNDTLRPILDALAADSQNVVRLRSHYQGRQPGLSYSSARYREAFATQLSGLVSNFLRLVVDTISQRLILQGFRFGNEDPDALVWDAIWQPNGLDADGALAFTDALVTGRCPVLVWIDPDSELPRITIEDARWTMVRYRPGNRRERLDAVKVWTDEEGFGRCSYFKPDVVRTFRTSQKVPDANSLNVNDTWVAVDSVENPFAAVPVVELRPRPSIDGTCSSEIEDLIGIQAAINKTLADAMVASEFSAFKQRWVSGIDVPRDDNGQPLQPFAETARLYVSESEGTKFGEFQQADLNVFSGFMTTLIEHLSSISGIPSHVLLRLQGQYPSGEALQAAESSLVDKARRYCANFGESLEEIMRLALRVLGDPRADDTSCEAVWRDPAQHSIGALVDGLLKLQALRVPDEALWAMYGATPQQIEAWRSQVPAPVPEPAQ